MSRIVEHEEALLERNAYEFFLKQLLQHGDLSRDAAGIVRLFLAKDRNSLSRKQQYILRTQVEETYHRGNCSACGLLIPWDECYEHMHSSSELCSGCSSSLNKFASKED